MEPEAAAGLWSSGHIQGGKLPSFQARLCPVLAQ